MRIKSVSYKEQERRQRHVGELVRFIRHTGNARELVVAQQMARILCGVTRHCQFLPCRQHVWTRS